MRRGPQFWGAQLRFCRQNCFNQFLNDFLYKIKRGFDFFRGTLCPQIQILISKILIKYVLDHILTAKIGTKCAFDHILSAKIVISGVLDHILIEKMHLFFGGGGHSIPKLGTYQSIPFTLGDRRSLSLVTGNTYSQST